ncbi:phage tail protein [Bradyrhizobium sp. 26S5]|uniref:phage tail protein n=1 Tax=Bradyrhizobium sp. 26S5 TaxID=3139729 RepID=UPI0030CADEBF
MANAGSSYLRHVPEIFRARSTSGATPFLGSYLKIFEGLLSGRDDAPLSVQKTEITGLEQILERYVDALDPAFAPVECVTDTASVDGHASGARAGNASVRLDSAFLTYLASWLALTLDQNWDLAQRRTWVKRIVPLYQRRGTRAALEEYLAMFIGQRFKLVEPRGFTLGKAQKSATTLGVDTFAGVPPHYFRVGINYGYPKPIADKAGILAEPFKVTFWKQFRSGTRAVLDLEKPAHTCYWLEARAPGIILGRRKLADESNFDTGLWRATLGRDTLIWQKSKPV